MWGPDLAAESGLEPVARAVTAFVEISPGDANSLGTALRSLLAVRG
jgi:hypothetical protein